MRGRIRIAIACAGLLATSVAGARAQSTFREAGSVTVGGYVVWVRGTSANAVELFVGRGFRDAFARAHEMDAAKLQQWIDSVRVIAPAKAQDSSVVDARAHGSVIGSDVTMIRRVGGSFPGLRLLVSGEEPITMAEPTARDFIAALDSATHAARALTPVPATAQMLPGDALVARTVALAVAVPPAVIRDTAPTPAPVAVAPVRVALPVIAPPVVGATVTPAPMPTIGVKAPSADSETTTPLVPSASQAPPELVLPPPREPVILIASRVDITPLPLPEPVVAPPAAASPVVIASPVAVAAPAVVARPTPAPDAVVPPHPEPPADKLIHTPLGPFTVPGALLADRDKEAQYCYTQLGLKYNPDLKGEITVKVLVGSDGAVQDAVVAKRSWQGISAGEVESCVRALAHDWTFASSDPSITDGAKLLNFSFAPPPTAVAGTP